MGILLSTTKTGYRIVGGVGTAARLRVRSSDLDICQSYFSDVSAESKKSARRCFSTVVYMLRRGRFLVVVFLGTPAIS